MVAIVLLCVFTTLVGSAHCQAQPQVISTSNQLKFVSANKQDIVFQPGIGGKLTLNGINILDKASLEGAKGDAGLTGPSGAKGEAGKDGVNGAKGDQGPQGVAGPTGPAGASGVNGQVGPQGQKGQAGQDGVNGVGGVKGAAGAIGPIGPKGDLGPSGPKGSKGDGATGATGPIGPKGEVGVKGSTGATGSKGTNGTTGAMGPPGPQGPGGNVSYVYISTGSSTSSNTSGGSSGGSCTSGCPTSILPQCPAWISKNTTLIPATGNFVVELALSGFSGLYHPSYEASYACRFKSVRQAVFSAEAPVTLLAGSTTHHVINCVAPAWKFGTTTTFKENVTVTLWYLDTTEIPFAGRASRQTATYYVGVNSFSLNKNSISVQGAGLDVKATYICRFNLSATAIYDSAPASPSSPAAVTCQAPSWPTGTARTFVSYTTVWIYQSGRAQAMIPFTGVSASVNVDLCVNGIKDGDETDTDCGGSCPTKCALGSSCKAGTDCTTTKCTNTKCVTKCTGWTYDGVCLQAVKSTTGTDTPPSGCSTYRPAKSWGRSDYLAICGHFGGATCASIDMDLNGGLCTSPSNPIMGYEDNSSPDVWLASPTFTYRPTSTTSPDCILIANLPGTIVYACR